MLTLDALTLALGDRVFCRDLSITFSRGQHWAILGPNGRGKTTLLHTLIGLRPPRAGEVRVGDRSLAALMPRERARMLALLPQHTTPSLASRVIEAAAIGRYAYGSRWRAHLDDTDVVWNALADVDLLHCAERTLDGLSGGELRRLAIATLLAQEAPIRLLDEPTNHLDPQHQHRVLDLIARDRARTLTVSVLHDVNLAARYCTHALLLGDGVCEHGAVTDVLTPDKLSRLYRCPVQMHATHDGPVFVTGARHD